MLTPGAYTSTHVPQLLNDALALFTSDAATVMASGRRAGETVQASTLELPAATETVMPLLMRSWRAASELVSMPLKPRESVACAGRRDELARTVSRTLCVSTAGRANKA